MPVPQSDRARTARAVLIVVLVLLPIAPVVAQGEEGEPTGTLRLHTEDPGRFHALRSDAFGYADSGWQDGYHWNVTLAAGTWWVLGYYHACTWVGHPECDDRMFAREVVIEEGQDTTIDLTRASAAHRIRHEVVLPRSGELTDLTSLPKCTKAVGGACAIEQLVTLNIDGTSSTISLPYDHIRSLWTTDLPAGSTFTVRQVVMDEGAVVYASGSLRGVSADANVPRGTGTWREAEYVANLPAPWTRAELNLGCGSALQPRHWGDWRPVVDGSAIALYHDAPGCWPRIFMAGGHTSGTTGCADTQGCQFLAVSEYDDQLLPAPAGAPLEMRGALPPGALAMDGAPSLSPILRTTTSQVRVEPRGWLYFRAWPNYDLFVGASGGQSYFELRSALQRPQFWRVGADDVALVYGQTGLPPDTTVPEGSVPFARFDTTSTLLDGMVCSARYEATLNRTNERGVEIRWARVLQDGVLGSRFDDGEGLELRVGASAFGGQSVATLTAQLTPSGGAPIDLSPAAIASDEWHATIPTLPEGSYALRVDARTGGGRVVTLQQWPAFVVGAGGCGIVPPVAHATITPSAAEIGQSVLFDATPSFAPGGAPLSYAWALDDGRTASTAQATFAFDRAQRACANLTVTSPEGPQDTLRACVVVGRTPSEPRDLVAQQTTTSGSVRLSWSRPLSEGGAPIAGYRIYKVLHEQAGVYELLAETTSTTKTLTGLQPRDQLRVVVRAHNSHGEGPNSAILDVVVPDPPSAPSGLWAGPGSREGTARLTWQPPAYQPPGSNTYEVWRAVGTAPFAMVGSSGTTTFEDMGLQPDVTYRYQVTMSGEHGRSAPSNTVSYALPGGSPDAPRDTQAQLAAEPGAIEVTWIPPAADGGGGVVLYRIYRALDGVDQGLAGESAQLRFVDVGRSGGSVYSYRVAAVNARGEGPTGAIATVSTHMTVGEPTAPGAAREGDGARVSWSPPAQGAWAVTGYEVHRALEDGAFSLVGSTEGAATFLDETIDLDQQYRYQVRALSYQGASGFSEVVRFGLAAQPTALTAARIPGNTGIALAWEAPEEAGSGLVGYEIERSSDDGAFTSVGASPGTTFTDAQAPAGVVATYRVRAVTNAGGSTWSGTASVLTPAGAPRAASAMPGDQPASVRLDWYAPNPGAKHVTGYAVERFEEDAWSRIATLPASTRTYEDAARVPLLANHYRIRVIDALGESPRAASVCSPASPWHRPLEATVDPCG